MKKAFTMLELIFIIIILAILAGIAIPIYLAESKEAHEGVLISFVRTLNRTTGVDLWSRSISEGKKGSIINLSTNEDAAFLQKYIQIPKEIDINSINLRNCGNNTYKTVMIANYKVIKGEYNITCKDGNITSAPYFMLIRLKDNKILVNR